MLTLFTRPHSRDCQRSASSRRDFLRVGGLSLGGLSLANLLAAKASGASYVRDKSVVLLYLSGGASHIETFDPKMTAPAEIRSINGEVPTSIPGVTFGATFPRLAKNADQMAVVRSFHHSVGSHDQAHVHVLTGGLDKSPLGENAHSIGSLFARLRGANHPQTGLPTYCLLTENEIDGQYRKELSRVHKGSRPGVLGPSYAPFNHIGDAVESKRKKSPPKTGLAADMQLNLPLERIEDRRALLSELDRLRRRLEINGELQSVDHFRQQAANLILGGASSAFELKGEDPRTIERYDTSHIRIGHKVFRPSTLGKQMLLARRLCEAGCGFVTVHSAGWDMHADGNNPGMVRGMDMLGRSLDIAVSAFLEDVKQRGLSQDILLVVTGDFGRTPKINKKGGRDHWARLGTLAFAGGGLKMGQVIGQSARAADVPNDYPVTPENLMATLMHTLLDVGTLRLDTSLPQELLKRVEEGRPISPLF